MKVGLVRMRYTPFGGAEVFLDRFAGELLRRGHSVELFTSDWAPKQGVGFHRVKVFGPAFLKPLVFAKRVRKEVERVRPDIVISFERTPLDNNLYRAGDGCHREWLLRKKEVSRQWKRPFIMLNPLHHVLLYLERKLFAGNVKKVVANSRRGKEEIVRHYGLPEEKICVIYNGINLAPFGRDRSQRARLRAEFGIPEDAVLLLFVGSGFERKGLLPLIRAVKLLREADPKVKLLVVGKGKGSLYEKEAVRLGVSDSLVMAGPRKDVPGFYASADIFVLPSVYEPFSNACLEAMASGLPVVTSRANGASEILTRSSGAIIENPLDEKEIADRIKPFLSRETRQAAGIAARAEAEKYPIEKNLEEFLRLVDPGRTPA